MVFLAFGICTCKDLGKHVDQIDTYSSLLYRLLSLDEWVWGCVLIEINREEERERNRGGKGEVVLRIR